MKKFEKILPLSLIAVMLMTFFGCGPGYPKGEPNLKDDQKMFIGAYCAPDPTDEAYKFAADCGITHMFVGGGNYWENYGYDTPEYYELPYVYAEKYGVNIVMHVQDTSYSVLGEQLEEIKSRKNFAGFLACDEPSAKRFDYFAKDYKNFTEDFPDTPYYINLLPIYAEKSQLGGVTYDEYINLYKEKILSKYQENHRVLMCDCYPLMSGSITYEKWLYNLEILRTAADSVKSDLYLFLQAQGFLGRWRQPTSTAELTYQMYIAMAYGTRGFAFYPYKTPDGSLPSEKAIIDLDGNKTYMFNLAQSMNNELKNLDGVYMGFDWKAVIGKAGKRNIDGTNINFAHCKNLQTRYGILSEVSSVYDTVVGCFQNDEGYQGFMAVNFTDPMSSKENEITLKFNGADKAKVYVKGIPETVELEDGKLTKKLGLGEGIFVIPYNG